MYALRTYFISKYVLRHSPLYNIAGLASRNIVLNISRCVSLAVVFDFSSCYFSNLANLTEQDITNLKTTQVYMGANMDKNADDFTPLRREF